MQQVLSLANPPLELIGPPDRTPELARMANDALAEICRRHPDRFPTFIASLPMNNIEASLAETDRAIDGARRARRPGVHQRGGRAAVGAEIPPDVPAHGRARSAGLGASDARRRSSPTTRARRNRENEIWFSFGWPYETTACMTRLIYSGLFDELPTLKIITPSHGRHDPVLLRQDRARLPADFLRRAERNPAAEDAGLKQPPVEYYKMLYADTALAARSRRPAAATPSSAPATACSRPTRRSIRSRAAG